MSFKQGLRQPGILAALTAALLFGAGTPLAKWLLTTVDPWLLAGLLYLGSGIGLTPYRGLRRAAPGQRLVMVGWHDPDWRSLRSSTLEAPLCTGPSTGTFSPGRTRTKPLLRG